MFRGMAVADAHVECAFADCHRVAVLDAPKAERHWMDNIGVIERLLRAAFFDGFGRHARRFIKRNGFGGRRLLIVEQEHPRKQPSRAGGHQFGPVDRLQPPRHADVIGVMVGDENTGDGFAPERTCEDFFPCADHAFGMKARVDYAPAVAVLQRVDVYVIEFHRKGQAQPKDTVRDLNGFALCWRRFVWKFDCRQVVFLCDEPWFGFAYGMRSG